MTLAPQSASWRAQVGPARTRVKSSTVKRASAFDARGKGTARTPFSFSAKLPKERELGRSFTCCLPPPALSGHHRAARLTKAPGRSHLSGASADDHLRRGRRIEVRWTRNTNNDGLSQRHRRFAHSCFLACRAGGGTCRASRSSEPARSEQGVPYPNVTGQKGPACCPFCRPISSPSMRSSTPAGKLAYTATAGTFSLFDQSGERSAAIFYTALCQDAATRPTIRRGR